MGLRTGNDIRVDGRNPFSIVDYLSTPSESLLFLKHYTFLIIRISEEENMASGHAVFWKPYRKIDFSIASIGLLPSHSAITTI